VSGRDPFHNPFAALAHLRGSLPPAPAPPPAPESAGPPEASASVTRIARAVVRMERSGRGGKEVTVIAQLGLADDARAEWLKALKSQLGCGGVVEGDTLVLQGDHRKRVGAILTARGVKKVVVG
jgi:translation initiation factor 1